MYGPSSILLIISNTALTRKCWAAFEHDCVTEFSSFDPQVIARCLILVTDDLEVTRQYLADHPQLNQKQIGLMTIATGNDADVCLPADVTERELKLAGQLLWQVLELRYQQGRERRSREFLEKLALRDSLTGLSNRRSWDVDLPKKLQGCCRNNSRLVLSIIDIDNFKQINANHGHPQGDQLLVSVARFLRQGLREQDLLARIGGDEFGVLLPLRENDWAPERVEEVRLCVARAGESLGFMGMTASAGFAAAPEVASDAAGLVAAADTALRIAKARGKDQSCSADD
ncbi:MAG: GGDEF domain-containing protein [Pirellulaceae bacterium]|nr:GGDEF domain-containing protein [Pirellulaceae bacterium]